MEVKVYAVPASDRELAQAYSQGWQDGRRSIIQQGANMNNRPELTRDMIFKCAQDAGQRSMLASGRTVWARNDWDAACAEFERLAQVAQDAPATKGE